MSGAAVFDAMEAFYPVFLRLDGKKAVVLGGGPVAARKVSGLLRAGARVTVVSPELCPELAGMAGEQAGGRVSHVARRYLPGDLDGAAIAVAATDDPEANSAACRDAEARGIPANSVRPPSAGSFIVPSSLTRGGLTLAISTGGGCPALSKRLRRDIEGFVGGEYGPFLEFLEQARALLKKGVPDEARRGEALTRLVESGLIERFRADGPDEARSAGLGMLDEIITSLKT